ncbi:MAG TPA: hypothetical protein VGC77_08615 [Rhodopseudomonas sp.]|uniref:hypothetical protein n=1 Tax=Rhodopseudomonas sp. TaxID=1078 RepID=UPI002ED7865E
MSKRFLRLKLDWQKFDEFAAHHQSWPRWKQWGLIAILCIGIFAGPAAFYHNEVMSISRFGVTHSLALSEHPIIFFIAVVTIEVILVFLLVVWVIALFFYDPFRSDT